jgi:hypothetical protein
MQGNLENSLWLRGRWVSGKNHMIFIIIFIIWSLQYLSCLFANKINTLNHSNMSFYNENTKIILKYKLIGIIINNNLQKKKMNWEQSFETRPGGQPDSRPRSWVLTESPGLVRVTRVNSFFFNSKRRCFDKKSTGYNQVFDQVNWLSQLGYDFSYFFLNLTQF